MPKLTRKQELTLAEIALDAIDAEVARHYVHDGQLSTAPLSGPLSETGQRLREARLQAVARLEELGGHDPHPSFLNEPTIAQREAHLHSSSDRGDERQMLAEELRALGCQVRFTGYREKGELWIKFPSGKDFTIYPDNYGDEVGVACG